MSYISGSKMLHGFKPEQEYNSDDDDINVKPVQDTERMIDAFRRSAPQNKSLPRSFDEPIPRPPEPKTKSLEEQAVDQIPIEEIQQMDINNENSVTNVVLKAVNKYMNIKDAQKAYVDFSGIEGMRYQSVVDNITKNISAKGNISFTELDKAIHSKKLKIANKIIDRFGIFKKDDGTKIKEGDYNYTQIADITPEELNASGGRRRTKKSGGKRNKRRSMSRKRRQRRQSARAK